MLLTIHKTQRGATLITALIMLIVLTLLVVSGIRSSSTNLRIVGNMQMQEEATAAAQQAIENVLSATPFVTTPQTVGNFTVTINSATCLSATPVVPTPALPVSCQSEVGSIVCYQTTWEIVATALDTNTGATAEIHQGASKMTNSDQAQTSCAQVIS